MDRVDVSIVTSGHDVADARLHREVAALGRVGLRVEVLGSGQVADGPPGAITRVWPRAGGLRRAWRAVRLPWLARGRVVIALDPDSAAGAWFHRGLHALSRRRPVVIADVHEDYALLLRDRPWATGLRRVGGHVWARLGRFAALRADLLVVADQQVMADAPDRIVLRNLPDRTMLPVPTERDEVPRALYVGDLRRSRGLFAMLDAVEQSPGWILDLVGPIAAVDRAAAEARMAATGLRGRVRDHGRLPPRQAWELARGAWVGLLLLEDTPAFRGAVPSKLYEYLACGLAVLTTDLPRSADLVTTTGAGIVVDGVDDAAATLRRWTQDGAPLDELRAAARRWAEHEASEPAAEFADAVRRLVESS